jgi:DNA replication protein DnaC
MSPQQEADDPWRAYVALALFGPYGVGKTHLLAALANEVGSGEKPCLYVSAITLFEVLQERIRQGREYHGLLKRAIHTPLLLMDDLDKVKPSEFRKSIYYLLIDKRRLAERPIALSCNVSPPELERWIGKAARSRLMMDLWPVEMQGPDYRTQSKQQMK